MTWEEEMSAANARYMESCANKRKCERAYKHWSKKLFQAPCGNSLTEREMLRRKEIFNKHEEACQNVDNAYVEWNDAGAKLYNLRRKGSKNHEHVRLVRSE